MGVIVVVVLLVYCVFVVFLVFVVVSLFLSYSHKKCYPGVIQVLSGVIRCYPVVSVAIFDVIQSVI